MEEIIILSEDEFLFLASLYKVTSVYGLSKGVPEKESQTIFIGLYSNGILTQTGEECTVMVTEPYKAAFELLAKSDVLLTFWNREKQLVSFYLGDRIVGLEYCMGREKMLRMTVLSVDVFYEYLKERELLPQSLIAEDVIRVEAAYGKICLQEKEPQQKVLLYVKEKENWIPKAEYEMVKNGVCWYIRNAMQQSEYQNFYAKDFYDKMMENRRSEV